MTGSSPSKSAATVSTARARPSACASTTTRPGPNANCTGLARSATRDTRLTASMNGPAGTSARQPNSAGTLDRYRMHSPAMSRAVSRRPPPSKLIMPSAGRGSPLPRASPPWAAAGVAWLPVLLAPYAIVTGTPAAIVLATSASVLAGTSAAARRPGSAGTHGTSRTARR